MKLHKEGKHIILIAFVLLALLTGVLLYVGTYLGSYQLWYQLVISIAAIVFYYAIVRFFRIPKRTFIAKENCLQISVFMSPLDVHINWFPFNGIVRYVKHHPGKHLVAWHPKSSKLNERTSVVVETTDNKLVMISQVAGAVARRIVCYANPNQEVKQNEELGFIKFGSRVDLYLPLSVKPRINLEDKVVGGVTVLAEF
ncbi:MAG: phosphatidylserine decarboxylase family protein [Bacteroidetes bacterium 4572_77]|nr:MAG: phosphatidylserine decarboxylase family protein [Bacteroidetes bacterium 4572_77]